MHTEAYIACATQYSEFVTGAYPLPTYISSCSSRSRQALLPSTRQDCFQPPRGLDQTAGPGAHTYLFVRQDHSKLVTLHCVQASHNSPISFIKQLQRKSVIWSNQRFNSLSMRPGQSQQHFAFIKQLPKEWCWQAQCHKNHEPPQSRALIPLRDLHEP